MNGSAAEAAWVAAWAAVGTAAVTIVLAIFAGVQLWQAGRIRREQSRPYVIIDYEFRGWLVYITMRNIGTTVARNVRVTFDPPPASAINDPPPFPTPLAMVAPGRTITAPFDSFPEREKRADLPMAHLVTIEYEDSSGRKYADPAYLLDLMDYYNTAIDPKGLPELVDEVSQLREEAQKWTEGIRGLRVFVVDKRRNDARRDRPTFRREAQQVRKTQGWRAWVRWNVDRWRRRYGWYVRR